MKTLTHRKSKSCSSCKSKMSSVRGRICTNCYNVKRRSEYSEHGSYKVGAMLRRARRRALEQNVPFTIKAEDIQIPKFCPVLGIELKTGEGVSSVSSATLDRIVPAYGYIPGNILVVSQRANTIKSDASLEEIKKVYEFYSKLLE